MVEDLRIGVIGAGAAGLTAACNLKKAGICNVVVHESDTRIGGRAVGDIVEGFHLDGGADFFCGCHDETISLCEELDLPLTRSRMNLGWFLNGHWSLVIPMDSVMANAKCNFGAIKHLGFLDPSAIAPMIRLIGYIMRHSNQLSFSGASRLIELYDHRTFGEYLDSIHMPALIQVAFGGFLEMTMGDVREAGAAHMLT